MPYTSLPILHEKVIFKLEQSIPSADAAASIKFGVEKVGGVSKVRFIGEDIEVLFDGEGAAMGLVLEALAEAGFPSAVAVGVTPLADTPSPAENPQYPAPGADSDDESEQGTGLAIA